MNERANERKLTKKNEQTIVLPWELTNERAKNQRTTYKEIGAFTWKWR